MTEGARIVVLGSRGSIPVSGAEFVRYGGNTTSVALVVGDQIVGFVDAGTGLVAHGALGLELAPSIEVFLTHYHWDHIQGLSMLDELWSGGCEVRLYGPDDPREVLTTAIAPPLFPVSIVDDATVSFAPMPEEVVLSGIRFTSFPLHHPQGAIGFRIDGPERSIAIVTDHESGTPVDEEIAEGVEGVDVLIHDAQYIPVEREEHLGWGHSTCLDAMNLAKQVGAGQLVLTSHDPGRTDAQIDAIIADMAPEFPATIAAEQGLKIDL